MTLLSPLLAFLVPLAISGLLTACLIRLAPRLGLIDQPSARKVHVQPTPRAGGLAIFTALVLTACWPAFSFEGILIVLGVGLVIVLVGLVDDLRPLPWQFRLGVQIVAAGVAVAWLGETSWLGATQPSVFGPPYAIWPLGVLWIVGLINAFNMLDNMDALSAGVAWIATALLALGSLLRQGTLDSWQSVLPNLMLMGALSGFLWFNRPPARIFMGDAGSTFLGFFLGVRTLRTDVMDPAVPWTWAVPVCVLAVACYDLTTVVVLRLRQGRSPFHADKQHLSHRLVELGLSSPSAVRAIYWMGLGSGLGGLALYQVRGWEGAALVVVGLACWWLAVAWVEYLPRFKKWKILN